VSTPGKPDPDAGARFLAKLLAQDEAERIESLSDEEFLAESKRTGQDAWPTPTTEELLTKVKARAAQQVQTAPDRAAQAAGREGAVRSRRVVWLLAAAVVVALLFAIANRPAIVARFHDDQGPQDIRPEAGPTPRERADELRDDALDWCAKGAWATCKTKLDEAAVLDPAGESEPRVQAARATIEKEQRHPEP
jgi:hypothetical protein